MAHSAVKPTKRYPLRASASKQSDIEAERLANLAEQVDQLGEQTFQMFTLYRSD